MSRRFAEDHAIQEFPGLTIFAAGSYGRFEASAHSDIDVFFIMQDLDSGDPPRELDDFNLRRMRVLAGVIRAADAMTFPNFSNDGEFLDIFRLSDILQSLGGRHDDYRNHFTARLLLLLEGKPLFGYEQHAVILDRVIDSYLRDYEDHPINFRPTFLVNDIMRFWKTLCLNYEHRRNQPAGDELRRRRQKIKNFKLKFSRMLTCYATIAHLSCYNNITKDELREIVGNSPVERLIKVLEHYPELAGEISNALELYSWFLGRTGLSTEKLEDYFASRDNREEAFSKADAFGLEIFKVLRFVSEKSGNLRYLLV
jgi:hypothetical protein